jgi:hypothetical protein
MFHPIAPGRPGGAPMILSEAPQLEIVCGLPAVDFNAESLRDGLGIGIRHPHRK